jgi:hypothetical protein
MGFFAWLHPHFTSQVCKATLAIIRHVSTTSWTHWRGGWIWCLTDWRALLILQGPHKRSGRAICGWTVWVQSWLI